MSSSLTYGPIKIIDHDTSTIRDIFLYEGFISTIFQTFKAGQEYGLIKKIVEDLELHVRIYIDNSLDSEIELSREYLEHPFECKPFYGPIYDVLKKYKIRHQITRYIPPDPAEVQVPVKKTPWKPIALAALAIIVGIGFIKATSE